MSHVRGRSAISSTLLALDRSLRSVDADGHMKVEESRISKSNICPYLGREIPNWEALGLIADKTYRLFRDPKELEKGASTFDGKPLLIRHVPIDAELPRKELWVGTVGVCTFEAPYLLTRPLMVLTKEAIDLIGSGEQRELSAAYRYEAEMVPGTWGGETYDGRMVNIRGNHVAIVSEGRAGPDVHVADELPEELRPMKSVAAAVALAIKPYLGKDPNARLIAVALDGMLGETPEESVMTLDAEECKAAEDAARDEKGSELTDEEREAAYEKARDRKRAKDKKARDKKAKDAKDKAARDKKAAEDAAARDAALDEREAAMDAREAAEDEGKEDDDEEAKDRKRARDSRKTARDKRAHDRGHKAHDELADPNDHRRDFRPNAEDSTVTKDELNAAVKAATDAERARQKDAAKAREDVRPLVGVVSMALDSAPEIYRFALKHAGVKTDGVHESALGTLVEMAVKQKKQSAGAAPTVAMDSQHAQLADVDAIFGSARAA